MLSNHTSDPIESQLREEALYKPYQSLNAYLKKKYGEKYIRLHWMADLPAPTETERVARVAASSALQAAVVNSPLLFVRTVRSMRRSHRHLPVLATSRPGSVLLPIFRHTPVRMQHLNDCMPCIIWRSPIRRSSGSLLPQDRTVCPLLSSM